MKFFFIWATALAVAFSCLHWAQAADPYERLSNTVVHVLAGGSGSVIESPNSHQKYIMTNWHVCIGGTRIMGNLTEDGVFLKGKVVYMEPTHDLCLIEVDQEHTALQLGTKLLIGDALYTHGYPHGKFRESSGRLEAESISALNVARILPNAQCPREFRREYNIFHLLVGCFYAYPFGITTLYGAPGSSGSAVVNSEGDLVGIVQSAVGSGNDAAGIIMLDRIQEFLKGH